MRGIVLLHVAAAAAAGGVDLALYGRGDEVGFGGGGIYGGANVAGAAAAVGGAGSGGGDEMVVHFLGSRKLRWEGQVSEECESKQDVMDR